MLKDWLLGYKRIMAESIWLAADFFPFFSPHFAPLLLVLYTTGSSLAFLSSFKKAFSGPQHTTPSPARWRGSNFFWSSLKTHARKLTGYFCKNSTPLLLFLLLMKSTGPTSFFCFQGLFYIYLVLTLVKQFFCSDEIWRRFVIVWNVSSFRGWQKMTLLLFKRKQRKKS